MNHDFQQSTNLAVSEAVLDAVFFPRTFPRFPGCSLIPDPGPFDQSANIRFQELYEEEDRKARRVQNALFPSVFDAAPRLSAGTEPYLLGATAGLPKTPVFCRIGRILSDCRRALRQLWEPVGTVGSLERALSDMIRGLSPAATTFSAYVTGRPRTLKLEFQEKVCLIAREALINALRHSRATRVEVDVVYQSRDLRLVIRDNGCGIDPQTVQACQDANRGLVRMHEEATSIGAHLSIFTRPGLGTEIEISLPNCYAPDATV